jgi:hypothetical protein
MFALLRQARDVRAQFLQLEEVAPTLDEQLQAA